MTQLSKNEFADIPPDNPWKNDVLERKAVADYLTPVLASIRQPFVVSLHSPYGTGKTYFLKAWRQDLDNKEFHTVYFNAWETDFSNDALSAFMVALKKQLFDPSENVIGEKVKGLMKEMAGFLRKEAGPMLARAALRKILGDEDAKALQGNFGITENNLSDLAGALADEALADQGNAEQSMESFKIALKGIVESLTAEEMDSEKKKIIIFVDELDRCRPTYAIEVLECIKHFFSVPGLVFVLAIDDRQLKSAIASVYGGELDGDGYLRRFIDWRFELPKPSHVKYGRFLVNRLDLHNLFDNRKGDQIIGLFRDTFGAFSGALGLSLRDQEKSISEIALAARANRNWREDIVLAWAVLGPLRMDRGNSIDGYLSNHLLVAQLLEELESKLDAEFRDNTGFDWKYVKSHIHALFLGGAARHLIAMEIPDLEHAIERKESDDEHPDNIEHLEMEVEYLKNVLGHTALHLSVEPDHSSFAAIANRYLVGTAQISPN